MPIEFHLYRAKFIRPRQSSFLHDDETPRSLFLKSLAEKPYAEFRKNYTWHIANLTELDRDCGYFAVGRNSPTSIPKLDPVTGDFVDTQDDTSPYTHVVYDAGVGLMAIRKESDLAPSTVEVAKKIEKLLGQSKVAMRNEIDVKIDHIPDPEDFISKLQDAVSIKKFTATFTGPNPFDADELFQKPLSVYLREARGSGGSTTVEGSSLDSGVVVSVARSTAASGNTASARVQEKIGVRPIRINLSGDPVKMVYEEEPAPSSVLKQAQESYRRVRRE
jgi:hypothetical protein